jgi:hypothetical protein
VRARSACDDEHQEKCSEAAGPLCSLDPLNQENAAMANIHLEILERVEEIGTFSANAANVDLGPIEKAIDELDRAGCFRVVNNVPDSQTGDRKLGFIMASGLTDIGREILAAIREDGENG